MELTPIFKLLSDETRIRVIHLLSEDSLCVCEMVGILDTTQPKISKILSKLRDMNLVADERRDKFVFYTLKDNNPLLKYILDYISSQIDDYPVLLDDHKRLTEKENYIDACSLALLQEIER